MDQIRVKKKQKEYALDDSYDIEDTDDAGLDELQSQRLYKSLEKMPSDEKALLLMKYQDDFSIKDISETLNISESAVKMRLLRSKEKLRKLYLENMAVFALIILKIIYLLRK
jgi:RNA polymerase sigma-70 factor (ECF subfamily)